MTYRPEMNVDDHRLRDDSNNFLLDRPLASPGGRRGEEIAEVIFGHRLCGRPDSPTVRRQLCRVRLGLGVTGNGREVAWNSTRYRNVIRAERDDQSLFPGTYLECNRAIIQLQHAEQSIDEPGARTTESDQLTVQIPRWGAFRRVHRWGRRATACESPRHHLLDRTWSLPHPAHHRRRSLGYRVS